MKAIILVALLAFVAQASLLDTESYVRGFSERLGFDSVEIASGEGCFGSVNQTVKDVQTVVQSLRNGNSDVLLTVLDLISTVNGPLKENCQAYSTDVLHYVFSASGNTYSEADLERVVEINSQKYNALLIQQITHWFDSLAAGDEYEAGSTEAYIIQFLVGAETPEEIAKPVPYGPDVVPLNATKFIIEADGAFYNTLGLDGKAISELQLECYNNISEASPQINHFASLFNEADGLEKIEVLRTTFDDLSYVIESCLPAFEAGLQAYAPVYEAIRRDPAKILTILHNVASNLPDLEQNQLDIGADIQIGDYAIVGEGYADQVKTVFANAGY